jgi:alpha-L-fucosidase
MNLFRLTFVALALAAIVGRAGAAPAAGTPDKTDWWQAARFGMFIHWGVYAIPADGEWHQYNHKMQVKDYEKYPPQFNPTHFSAHDWVKAAKDAGMKYIVFTTKHHDGFSMFDTQQSDYSVVKDTPWHHDPVKDLAAECKRQGMRLGFYYSLMDWHHPDYLPRRDWETETRPADGADWDRYIAYMKAQLRELLTNYGPVAVIWFDGGWEHTVGEWHSQEILDLIHSIQPNTLVNDRTNLPADFATPEQRIPSQALSGDRLWETCMTMNDNWGYSRTDHNWKSPADLVHKLADIAGKGGNFLLNVGPTEDGAFPPEAVERLQQIGRWMRANGRAVYGTTRSPFRRLSFDGRCTRAGDTLYLHVFQWPEAGLKLTGLETPVASARVLDGGERLTVTSHAAGPGISRPARLDAMDTVIEVRLKGAPVVAPPPPIAAAPGGRFILAAQDADIHGGTAQLEDHGGVPNIGYWTDAKDSLSWRVTSPSGGNYHVDVDYACDGGSAGSGFEVQAQDVPGTVQGVVQTTGDWGTFRTVRLDGTLRLPEGTFDIRVAPTSMPHGAVMNLRSVTLTPAG